MGNPLYIFETEEASIILYSPLRLYRLFSWNMKLTTSFLITQPGGRFGKKDLRRFSYGPRRITRRIDPVEDESLGVDIRVSYYDCRLPIST